MISIQLHYYVDELRSKYDIIPNIALTPVFIYCCVLLPLIFFRYIEQKLENKSHGRIHYKIGVTCVYNGHKINTLL